MSSYHVGVGSDDGNSFTVIFHIPVPAGNNRAAFSYRTSLVNSGLGGKSSLTAGDGTGGTISAAELTLVQSGQIYEVVEPFWTTPGETAAQLQARVDARFNALKVDGLAALQKRLTYYAFARDVP